MLVRRIRYSIKSKMLLLPILLFIPGCSINNVADALHPMVTAQAVSANKNQITETPNPIDTMNLGYLGKPFDQPALVDQDLVWAGDKEGELHNSDAVYFMDLTKKVKQLIASSKYASDPHITCPQVSKNWITWLDSGVQDNQPGYTLYAYNRSSGKTTQIASFSAIANGDHMIAWANLQEERLIWFEQSKTGGNFDLKMCDLSDMQTKTIANVQSTIAPSPYQSGDTIIWGDGLKDWKGKIETLDMTTGKRSSFDVEGPFSYPKIDGNYCVYSPKLSSDGMRDSLVVVNLQNSESTTIHANDPYFWDIGDGFVSWSENSGQTSKVFVKPLSSVAKPIELGDGALPYVFGNRLIWQSVTGDQIYVTKINK